MCAGFPGAACASCTPFRGLGAQSQAGWTQVPGCLSLGASRGPGLRAVIPPECTCRRGSGPDSPGELSVPTRPNRRGEEVRTAEEDQGVMVP